MVVAVIVSLIVRMAVRVVVAEFQVEVVLLRMIVLVVHMGFRRGHTAPPRQGIAQRHHQQTKHGQRGVDAEAFVDVERERPAGNAAEEKIGGAQQKQRFQGSFETWIHESRTRFQRMPMNMVNSNGSTMR